MRQTLLAAFKQRSQALRILLTNVSLRHQPRYLGDHRQPQQPLNHVLAQLRTVSEELVKRKNERRCNVLLADTPRFQRPSVPTVLQGDGGQSAALPDSLSALG